ncbi:rCG51536 [Rattus norvegicus]|uniref:RCG51536 n=1 Tax=Rattus norvegicus TaxID=10116 RepID=A6IZS6_RAT|nr:rCG51536 [Rattus norvegicus]
MTAMFRPCLTCLTHPGRTRPALCRATMSIQLQNELQALLFCCYIPVSSIRNSDKNSLPAAHRHCPRQQRVTDSGKQARGCPRGPAR